MGGEGQLKCSTVTDTQITQFCGQADEAQYQARGREGMKREGKNRGRGEGGKERSHFLFYNLSTGYPISKTNG